MKFSGNVSNDYLDCSLDTIIFNRILIFTLISNIGGVGLWWRFALSQCSLVSVSFIFWWKGLYAGPGMSSL